MFNTIIKLATLLAVSIFAVTAFAAPQEKEGFSGYLDAGIFAVSSTDTLTVSGNNEEIDSLDENSDRFGLGTFAMLFEVKYKKDNLVYHAGTPMEGGDPQFELGVKNLFGTSSIDFSLVVEPMTKVWEDPYVLDRDSTKSAKAGFKVKYDNIGGTPHVAEIKVMGYNVDDDKIGERFDSMKRDGYSAEIGVGYHFKALSGQLTPTFSFKHDHRDGDAMSSKGTAANFVYVKPSQTSTFIAAVALGYDKFDEESPIFGKTREDTEVSTFILYNMNNVFGWKNKHVSFAGGASDRYSNIDF